MTHWSGADGHHRARLSLWCVWECVHSRSEQNSHSALACKSAQHAWQACLHPRTGQKCHSRPACELAHHACPVGLWGAGTLGYLRPAYDPQMGRCHQSELALPCCAAGPIATTVAVVAPCHQSDIWLRLDDAQANQITVQSNRACHLGPQPILHWALQIQCL